MGNIASSDSRISNTQQAYVSAIQNISNTATANAVNSFRIRAGNVSGDVNISNIDVKQQATASVKAQFGNTNSSDILQKVATSLDNTSQSMVSGLGLGNSSNSTAIVNNYVNSAVEVSQSISNQCSATAQNIVDISAENVGGNVTIGNVTAAQGADAAVECIATNVQSVVAKQEQDTQIKNSAESVTKGLQFSNPFVLILILVFVFIVIFLIVGYSSTKGIVSSISNTATSVFSAFTNMSVWIIMMAFASILSGIFLIRYYSSAISPPQTPECVSILAAYQKQQKLKQFFIKPFFYTCGIYGKGTDCQKLFNPPVIVGNFSSFSPNILTNTTTTGGTNNCKFQIHDLTTQTFNDISDAYTSFVYTEDCQALDLLHSLDGRVQYIFYKSVEPMCYRALHNDMNQDIPVWKGIGDVSTVQRNEWLPPLMCVVLPCIENLPDPNDILVRPYYIRISRNGFVYYFKNNMWVQVNDTSFWTKTPPPLTNILVYRGTPDQTADLLDISKNPTVDMTKSVAYIDINADKNGTFFNLYWKEKGSDAASDAFQGFVYVGKIDCTRMAADGVIAYAPNPLIKFMNKTWVKLYSPDPLVMTSDDMAILESKFTSEQQQKDYTICQNGELKIQSNLNTKKNMIGLGIGLIILGILIGILFFIYSKMSAPVAPAPVAPAPVGIAPPPITTPSPTTAAL